ncbi:MAG TPA: hypothetical protein VGG25_07240 [Streptosporangiaceae bacterium]|jgi:hypothetical protein
MRPVARSPLARSPLSRSALSRSALARLALAGCAALAVTATGVGPAQASAAHGSAARPAGGPVVSNTVLVNQPAGRVCTGATFKVGIWYQKFSGGSRAYRVSVYNPRGKRVLYRHGDASAAHWRYWKVRATRAGRYRTVYSGHWAASGGWRHYKVTTRARHC